MKPIEKLKIAVQKSGRLSEQSIALLKNAGLNFDLSGRELMANCHNFPLEILFFRADDIPEIIHDGTVDCGICGQNSIAEKGFNLRLITKLNFGKCRLSIAIPDKANTDFDLNHKKIATSYPKILRKYLRANQIKADIVELRGSVEIAPRLQIADAVCDLVSSGSTLKTNGLIEYEQIFCSEAILSANTHLNPSKKALLDKLNLRIQGVITAKQYKYIIMNAPRSALTKIKTLVPGLKNPTIADLADDRYISISTVVQEDSFWETIEKLKQCGASDILVMPIEKMII